MLIHDLTSLEVAVVEMDHTALFIASIVIRPLVHEATHERLTH